MKMSEYNVTVEVMLWCPIRLQCDPRDEDYIDTCVMDWVEEYITENGIECSQTYTWEIVEVTDIE